MRAVKYQRSAAFIAVSLLFLFLHHLHGVTEFYWDAKGYWVLANTFEFPKTEIRGYFYPTILSPAAFLSKWAGLIPYKIISSLAYGYAFAVLLPDFHVSVFGGRLSFWRRLIVPGLVVLLFPGVVIYSLSDLPGLTFLLGALYCVKMSVERRWLLLPAGILAYGAYNTRTVFLFSLAVVIIALPAVIYRHSNLRTKVVALSLFFLGLSLASLPQAFINLKNRDIFWPGVITDRYSNSLFATHLLWGITIQRYETSLVKSLPAPGLIYLDPAGARLFEKDTVSGKGFSIKAYLKAVFTKPGVFIGIYGRHFINGLDLRDGEVYTTGLSRDKWLRWVLNLLIVFAGFTVMAVNISFLDRNSLGARLAFGAVLLLPVLLAIPGAIETRFFLPLHLAIYSVLAFHSDALRGLSARRWAVIAAAFMASAVIFFYTTMLTMANLRFDHPAIYR
jgi:hypothetical protein